MVLHRQQSHAEAGPSTIKSGDLVIVYERHDTQKAVYVNPRTEFSNRFGNFKMEEWIGQPFGCKVTSKGGRGWVYLLAPSPLLWTNVLKHRTQILYTADISLACSFMELRPGSIVLESGTGSGSLTTSLAQAVAMSGHVHTFEFHQVRAELAAEEFKKNGLGNLITVQHRNIEELGFPAELHGRADAVFLDLPGPWKVVESARLSLRPNGVFCSFSPCIEQVQRTCAALAENRFFEIRTVECLLRQYELRVERVITDLDAAPSEAGGKPNKKRKRDEWVDKSNGSAVPAAAPVAEDAGAIQRCTYAKPIAEARGHTGYLTFARRSVDADDGSDSEESDQGVDEAGDEEDL